MLAKMRQYLLQHPAALNNPQGSAYTRYYFCLCLLGYSLFILVQEPGLAVSGDMFLEMGGNYYANAESASWLNKLLAPDAGYLPFLQRLIAVIPNILAMPAIAVPYFYAGVSILFTAGLVCSFCAQRFRVIVPSDLLRGIIALIVLLSASAETRLFFNFTYFGGFFMITMLALSLAERHHALPGWSWLMPLLIINKPVFLIFVPLLLLTALINRGKRLRWLTIVSVVLALVQLMIIYHHHRAGVCWHENVATFYERYDPSTILLKLWWSYLLLLKLLVIAVFGPVDGMLNHCLFGHYSATNGVEWLRIGLVGSVTIMILLRRRNNASLLTIVSLVVAYAVCLFNNLILPPCAHVTYPAWQPLPNDLAIIMHSKYYKIANDAVLLSVIGLVLAVSMKHNWWVRIILPLSIILWFWGVGWWSWWLNPMMLQVPNHGAWQQMAGLVDNKALSVCVPLGDPGWFYMRNCRPLTKIIELFYAGMSSNLAPLITQQALFTQQGAYSITIKPPPTLQAQHLLGIMVYIRTMQAYYTPINMTARLYLRNGQVLSWFGTYTELPNPALFPIMAASQAVVALAEIHHIVLQFSVPVSLWMLPQVMSHSDQQASIEPVPFIEWLGR